jgi:Spy/CpxP family protein refolding chaperone
MRPIVGLESPTVRRELRLTDQQEQKASSILEKVREARKKSGLTLVRGAPRLSIEERRARLAEFVKTMAAANEEATTLLADGQMARFKQIRLWIEPEKPLFCQEIITELKLVTVQTDALTAIYEKYQKKLPEMLRPAEGTIEEQRSKLQDRAVKVRKEAAAEFMGVLTKEQREQFDKMRGPKFEVDMSEIVGEGP